MKTIRLRYFDCIEHKKYDIMCKTTQGDTIEPAANPKTPNEAE